MKLYATTTSERGKEVSKCGNEFISFDLSVNREVIGRVELYYYNDIKENGSNEDEWVLTFKADDLDDGEIIAQGNTTPQKRG